MWTFGRDDFDQMAFGSDDGERAVQGSRRPGITLVIDRDTERLHLRRARIDRRRDGDLERLARPALRVERDGISGAVGDPDIPLAIGHGCLRPGDRACREPGYVRRERLSVWPEHRNAVGRGYPGSRFPRSRNCRPR